MTLPILNGTETVEVRLELTQEEANKVAAQLENLVAYIRQCRPEGIGRKADTQLFASVAQSFRNATEDERQRESDDDYQCWANKEN